MLATIGLDGKGLAGAETHVLGVRALVVVDGSVAGINGLRVCVSDSGTAGFPVRPATRSLVIRLPYQYSVHITMIVTPHR